MIGQGVVPPAKFKDIVKDIFQNEKIKNADGTKVIYTSSAVTLTNVQVATLTYPVGFVPFNTYLVYTVDTYDANDVKTASIISLVSFITKNDGFIYGYYFDVTDITLDSEVLKKAHGPLTLDVSAVFTATSYLELYNKINCTTVILGLSTVNPVNASIQFATKCKYYYTEMIDTGIVDPLLVKAKLTGLSKNLKKLKLGHPIYVA
jgi:hypothetical protein